MNPIGILTYYLLRVVALSDVSRFWLRGRKLRRCVVQGPGTVLLTGNDIRIVRCTFQGCDFLEVEDGAVFFAGLPATGMDAERVVFDRVTFIAHPRFIGRIRDDVRQSACEILPVAARPGLVA